MLEETEFRRVAHEELEVISKALDRFPELSVDLANDILTIEFDDGAKFVGNLQGPSRQIWFSANFAAGHYDFEAVSKLWLDSKTKESLRERVKRDVALKLGRSITL